MLRTTVTDERGSALPLLAIMLATVALALGLVLVQAQHRVRVARAQWAADGSALAAASDVVAGPDAGGSLARAAAVSVAEANGARVVSIQVTNQASSHHGIDGVTPISPTVVVEIELDGVVASAAAARFAVAGP